VLRVDTDGSEEHSFSTFRFEWDGSTNWRWCDQGEDMVRMASTGKSRSLCPIRTTTALSTLSNSRGNEY